MEKKKVSIILPVYNGASHVSASIKSILAQTYSNWELIIVNDCSTDNTLDICSRFAEEDSRIKVISNGHNLKLPKTLNAGFREATGEYYTWTSDDNMYKPEAIASLVDTLEKNPDVVMVYSDYVNIDGEGNEIAPEKLQDPQYLVTGNIIGACFMYTAVVAKKVGEYDTNLFLAEDYDYWMRIYRQGKLMHITDCLYLYRRHAGSLTETKKALIKEQTYKAIEKNFLPLYADAKKHGLSYDFFNHVLARADAHADETQEMLMTIDSGYKTFLKKCAVKESIRNIGLHKFFLKLKGTSC
jgi:glycosyltransferase involved in cell wall biosynthesis